MGKFCLEIWNFAKKCGLLPIGLPCLVSKDTLRPTVILWCLNMTLVFQWWLPVIGRCPIWRQEEIWQRFTLLGQIQFLSLKINIWLQGLICTYLGSGKLYLYKLLNSVESVTVESCCVVSGEVIAGLPLPVNVTMPIECGIWSLYCALKILNY